MSAVEIVEGQRYRVTFEGVALADGFLDHGGYHMSPGRLAEATSIEPITPPPPPLPTTPGSVVEFDSEGMRTKAHLAGGKRWVDDDQGNWVTASLAQRNPTVLFDAGASS